MAEGLRSLQIPVDSREFVAHLTLGRVKSARHRHELVEAIQAVGETSFGRVDAGRVVLMQSRLKPTGAEYTVVHEAPFQG